MSATKARSVRLRKANEQENRHATWLELFYDLVFVSAIGALGQAFLHDLGADGLLRFIALFITIWWAWVGQTVYVTRFDSDDPIHRSSVFIQMFLAAVMAIYVPKAFGEGATVFALAYIGIRVMLLGLYSRAWLHSEEARPGVQVYLMGFSLGAACWALSLAFDGPVRYGLWALGLLIDFLTPWIMFKPLRAMPLDTAHFPERFGLFTLIVLGESVFAVVRGLSHMKWTMTAGLAALCVFTIAVCFWWLYFAFLEGAADRCFLGSGQPFIYAHLPLLLGLSISSVGLEAAVLMSNYPRFTSATLFLLGAGLAIWFLSYWGLRRISRITQDAPHMSLAFACAALTIVGCAFAGYYMPPLVVLAGITFTMVAVTVLDHRDEHTPTLAVVLDDGDPTNKDAPPSEEESEAPPGRDSGQVEQQQVGELDSRDDKL